jgi:hypothetical protein
LDGKWVLGAVLLLVGMLGVTAGLLIVIERNRLNIVMTDQAVHVGRLLRTDAIPYRDIRRVESGIDCVLLEVSGKQFHYPILDTYFHSAQERISFMEELSKRVRDSKPAHLMSEAGRTPEDGPSN